MLTAAKFSLKDFAIYRQGHVHAVVVLILIVIYDFYHLRW